MMFFCFFFNWAYSEESVALLYLSNLVKITRILTADEGLTVHEVTVRCGTLQPDCTAVEFSEIVLCRWFVHMSKLAEKNNSHILKRCISDRWLDPIIVDLKREMIRLWTAIDWLHLRDLTGFLFDEKHSDCIEVKWSKASLRKRCLMITLIELFTFVDLIRQCADGRLGSRWFDAGSERPASGELFSLNEPMLKIQCGQGQNWIWRCVARGTTKKRIRWGSTLLRKALEIKRDFPLTRLFFDNQTAPLDRDPTKNLVKCVHFPPWTQNATLVSY